MKSAPVLLLDEAINQVDVMATTEILKELRVLSGRRTIVMVAHDPAVAQAADRVLFIDSLGAVHSGSHRDLAVQLPAYGRWLGLAQKTLSEEQRVH
jgi:ATP-binding cassette subfamily B protein